MSTKENNGSKIPQGASLPKIQRNRATPQGILKEPMAREYYKTQDNVVIKACTVCVGHEWLSASPDGIVNGIKVLKIKCPDTVLLQNLILSGTYFLFIFFFKSYKFYCNKITRL